MDDRFAVLLTVSFAQSLQYATTVIFLKHVAAIPTLEKEKPPNQFNAFPFRLQYCSALTTTRLPQFTPPLPPIL